MSNERQRHSPARTHFGGSVACPLEAVSEVNNETQP
jgi:hypothetical protein